MSYLAVNVEILFPAFRDRKAFKLKSVSTFNVGKSWKSLTGTAEIVISHARNHGPNSLLDRIKTGDPVEIRGGYNGTYYDEFKGFISYINDDIPIVLKCEDSMYLLKRKMISKYYKSINLQKLIREIIPSNFEVDAADIEVGDILFKNIPISMALLQIKDSLGLYSYFDGNKLVCGKTYLDNTDVEKVKYKFGKNIISYDLEHKTPGETKIKIVMECHLPKGKKKTVSYGPEDGVPQKLVCSGITNDASLKKLAQMTYEKMIIEGATGTITSFGIPFVKHGWIAEITHPEHPEKGGTYYIDDVKTSLDTQGAYRRVVTIGKKAVKPV